MAWPAQVEATTLVALTAGAWYARRRWLVIETLLVLLVVNAIVAFVVAMGWPK